MAPDFAACGAEFLNGSTTIYSNYVFNGTVGGILNKGRPALITLEGCRKLCGDGIAYYAWYVATASPEVVTHQSDRKDAANTITTWVLPIIGLLVQAPFESNQAWQTLLSLCKICRNNLRDGRLNY